MEDAESAVRILRMYRQRWAVEDSFKFTKEVLGWEKVQLLNLQAIRTLLALAWVAAGYLYELGVTSEWEEVRLLARLGGWVERKDNPPSKIVLTRGLRRIMDMLYTQTFFDRYREEHGALPPRIAAWVGDPPSGELWPNVNATLLARFRTNPAFRSSAVLGQNMLGSFRDQRTRLPTSPINYSSALQ